MHRRRVFIVASLHGDPRDVLLSQTSRCTGECASEHLLLNGDDAEARTQTLCYECFHNDLGSAEPASVAACVDFTEKRRPPVLHELESLTPRNARRLCVVREELCKNGRAAAGMLSARDVERLMGFPEEWTEPCARASRAHTPENDNDAEGRAGSPSESTPVSEAAEKNEEAVAIECDAKVHKIEPGECKTDTTNGGIRTPTEIEGDRARRERSANESVAREGSEHSEAEHPKRVSMSKQADQNGESSDDESLPITAQEAFDIVRIMLMASATAVPQAKWIGERLFDPYGRKFNRHGLGIPFTKEVVGGLDEPEGRAWAEAGWNVNPGGVSLTKNTKSPSWVGRHALRDCGNTPVHDTFVPLGSFLKTHGTTPSADAAAQYVMQLQIAHTDIPGFVMDALDPYGEASAGDTAHWAGDKPHATELIPLEDLADLASAEPSIAVAAKEGEEKIVKSSDGSNEQKEEGSVGETDKVVTDEKPSEEEPLTPEELLGELSGSEDEGNHDDPFLQGTPVWAPWKLGKGDSQVLWPGISLDRVKDSSVIPDAALKVKQPKNATPESHKLVVFFGDRTYMWLPVNTFHDFEFRGEAFEKRVAQNVKRHSATFDRACAEARVWGRTWRRLRAQEACKKRKRREVARKAREAAKEPEKKVEEPKPEPKPQAVATPEGKERGGNCEERTPNVTTRNDRSGSPDSSPGLFGVEDFGPEGYSGSLISGAEPEPCGACRVCEARTPAAVREQALGLLSKKGNKSANASDFPNVPRHMKCPQVSAVRVARTGHCGALISLRREGAVGTRVRVLWDEDDRFYRGRVSRFNMEQFTHDVEFDDGEVSCDLRLWCESVQTVDPSTDPHPNGRRFVLDGPGPGSVPYFTQPPASGKKRKSPPKEDATGAKAQDPLSQNASGKKRKDSGGADDLAGAQRCEACARSHKGISYCAARGHVVNGAKRSGEGVTQNAGKGPGEFRNDGAPRVAARRGGNGKFVVSESVGSVLLGAGLGVPERCQLCIRRKKGLAHCLKKQHIWLTPEQSAVLAKTPAAPKRSKATKDAKAGNAAAAAVAQAAAPAMHPALMQMPMPPGMSPQDAAHAQAAAAAAMAAAMMGMGAMPVPMGMAMPRPPQ